MSKTNQFRAQMIAWNNRFPLDHNYRKKYNIAFGSEEHRALNQIDIYLEWLEDNLYKEYQEKAKDDLAKEDLLKQGVWIRETVRTEDEDVELWDKLNVSQIKIE